jgi:aminoglycoside 6'-N-acetyltransferase I
MSRFAIRPVARGDRDEWLRLRRALWPDSDDHAGEIDAFLAGEASPLPLAAVFVAERTGGGLCGFAEAGLRPFADACEEAPCAYLEGLIADPDMRRTGVASALVAAVEAWARARGHRELGSDYLIDNAESEAFHAAAGFDVVERLVIVRKPLK